MTFKDLVGQETVAAALRRAVGAQRVAHAYLFVGPEAVGKRSAALCLAKVLNCAQPREGDACDHCDSCRRIELGVHPDVRVIGPTLEDSRGYLTPVADDAAGAAVIRMAQIRVVPRKPRQTPPPLVHDIALRPASGRWKVYIVSPADLMQTDTPNALLHVLEEPPPYAVIVLVSARPGKILPTIHSRCREVRFRLAPAAEIAACLESRGLEPARAERLARLAAGRVGWAIRAAGSPELLRAREALVDWVEGLCQAHPQAALRMAEDLRTIAYESWSSAPEGEEGADQAEAGEEDSEAEEAEAVAPVRRRGRLSEDQVLRAQLPECLEVVLSWLRDLAIVRAGRADLAIDPDRARRAKAADGSLSDLRRAISAVQRAIRYIERNASIPITTDALAEALIAALGRPER